MPVWRSAGSPCRRAGLRPCERESHEQQWRWQGHGWRQASERSKHDGEPVGAGPREQPAVESERAEAEPADAEEVREGSRRREAAGAHWACG